ncbi:hypothetical protein [Gordonia sp. IITR100]|uniref:hypothetical protein n=1 Tax=Gordonia sp. IITR100 TaxID=1314686 RepID=UPI0009911601|nr:hypothetical protein [Gordonia sp. IITR100]
MYVAAALTVLTAVVMDVVAGEHPIHMVTLGLAATAVAAVRVFASGRLRGCAAVLSGVVVCQPAVHASTKLFPETSEHATQASVSAVHVMFAAVMAAAVACAQVLLELVVSVSRITLALVWLTISRGQPIPAAPMAPAPAPNVPLCDGFAVSEPLRGPPKPTGLAFSV